jgi:heme A synthase
MVDFYNSLGMIAPYYNLVFVLIVVWLFIVLFKYQNKKTFMKPWYLLFVCVCLFILEEILTVLRAAGLTAIPHHINAFFELGIIIIFIYFLLVQKEHIKKAYKSRK